MTGKKKNQEGEMVQIPHEYLIDGIKQAASEIKLKMMNARSKYGNRYNSKNDYEEFGRRFGYDDPEKIWTEYDRVWNKQSNEPAVIRKVLKLLGDMARYYAVSRMNKEAKQKAETKE